MTGQIVIGFDGGGTSTRAAIATQQGEVLGVGKAGTGNYHDVGVDMVRSNLNLALTRAWAKAGIAKQQADAAFLGLGSVASREDRDTIRQLAKDLSLARNDLVGVDHDLRVALAGGLVGKPGIILIAGTGASCFGRSADGRTWRSGGWGPLLDDIGSSGWLGLQCMVAAVREYDGRGMPTALTTRVLEALEIADINQIMRRVDSEGLTRLEMASLARLVTQAASQGDRVAREIIEMGTDELARLIATVESKLGLANSPGKVPVAVTGGLAQAGPVFLEPLHQAIQRRTPACEVIKPKLPPVLGAVLIAIESLDIMPSADIVENLIKTQHPHQSPSSAPPCRPTVQDSTIVP